MAEKSVKQDNLENLLKSALKPSCIKVEDFSDGCGAKFNCLIVSEEFNGKAMLERHRMVHAALGDMMDSIHALTMKTYTKEQYEKMNKS